MKTVEELTKEAWDIYGNATLSLHTRAAFDHALGTVLHAALSAARTETMEALRLRAALETISRMASSTKLRNVALSALEPRQR